MRDMLGLLIMAKIIIRPPHAPCFVPPPPNIDTILYLPYCNIDPIINPPGRGRVFSEEKKPGKYQMIDLEGIYSAFFGVKDFGGRDDEPLPSRLLQSQTKIRILVIQKKGFIQRPYYFKNFCINKEGTAREKCARIKSFGRFFRCRLFMNDSHAQKINLSFTEPQFIRLTFINHGGQSADPSRIQRCCLHQQRQTIIFNNRIVVEKPHPRRPLFLCHTNTLVHPPGKSSIFWERKVRKGRKFL